MTNWWEFLYAISSSADVQAICFGGVVLVIGAYALDDTKEPHEPGEARPMATPQGHQPVGEAVDLHLAEYGPR